MTRQNLARLMTGASMFLMVAANGNVYTFQSGRTIMGALITRSSRRSDNSQRQGGGPKRAALFRCSDGGKGRGSGRFYRDAFSPAWRGKNHVY